MTSKLLFAFAFLDGDNGVLGIDYVPGFPLWYWSGAEVHTATQHAVADIVEVRGVGVVHYYRVLHTRS